MSEKRKALEYDELYDLLCDMLSHDEVMAYCVLEGSRGPLKNAMMFERLCGSDVTPMIRWMGNLMTLAGAFLFSKFNKWRSENGKCQSMGGTADVPNALYLKRMLAGVEDAKDVLQRKSSAAFRTLRVLDGLYDIFDMNFFVIKNIIINSQLEAGFNTSNNGRRNGLSKMLGFPDEESFLVKCELDDFGKKFYKQGKNLSNAFSLINFLRNDPLIEYNYNNPDKYDPDEIKCAFEDVFLTMEFMKRIRLDIDPDGNVVFWETKPNEKEPHSIPSYGVVKVFTRDKENKSVGLYKPNNKGFSDLKAVGAEFYLLERMLYHVNDKDIDRNKEPNAALSFVYKTFDEDGVVSVYFTENDAEFDGFVSDDCDLKIDCEGSAADCFKRISGYLPGTRSATSFFRGMITTHYRYHNTLAPSIVDAIDKYDKAKVRILKKFVKTDPEPFKESFEPVFKTLEQLKFMGSDSKGRMVEISALNSWEDKVDALCKYINANSNQQKRIIDWDTLIARILVYDGPTEILRTILLPDDVYNDNDRQRIEDICNEIIAGLEMRYIDEIFEADDVIDLKDKYIRKFDTKIKNYREIFPDEYATKMECVAVAQTYIDAIVRTLMDLKEEERNEFDAGNKFAENSIKDMLEILKIAENDEGERSSIKAKRAFNQTVLAFISFYAGIKKSSQARISYEFDKSAKIIKQEEVKEKQDEIMAAFIEGVTEKTVELSKLFGDDNSSVEAMLKELWKFANNEKDEKFYNAVLARAPIDRVRLRKIFKADENGAVFFVDHEKEMLVPFAGVCQRRGRLVRYLRKIVSFLYGEDVDERRRGEPDKSNYTLYKEHVKRVVYPQIVTFAKRREDGDANNCLLMDHNGAFAEWHNGEVQILTEFEYKINHAYYAMPNLNRVETEWWVDPILISCYEFDNVLCEALEKVKKEKNKEGKNEN